MHFLNLGEAAPLNTARHGRKSFSILESTATSIACTIGTAVHTHSGMIQQSGRT
jgi:hypothetical protein